MTGRAGSPARHAAAADRRPGDLLVRAGGVLFVLGVAAVVVAVVPFLLGRPQGPAVPTLLAAVLLPLGFGLALVGLLVGARSRRRG